MASMKPDDVVQFYENWMPGIGECTELHDELHDYYNLGFSVRDEARLLGFQLGHHPAGHFFHVIIFTVLSTTIYPKNYRNNWDDIKEFYRCYLLGKYFQMVPYYFVPINIFKQ